ncbi:MAG TPA: hypothetical protein PLL06_21855 [Acidobacteriota bacterium]|nr:hypothetical protein [Acidobacteriota bacterium]HMZ82358.1 hypothetical protein [Acidobacteriota bacterium]HNC42752.1 hypothetical protein [Acidobacteriota bacterium]HND17977.1 hypothetical protein [Acidobacteriota bacterium]HNG91161.1 hypothetical protein [Acidobacteriota bacterium]
MRVNESELPTWSQLPEPVQVQFTAANISQPVFDSQLNRRRADCLNFYAALTVHGLWECLFIEVPSREVGLNSILFRPQPDPRTLLERIKSNPAFTNLKTTIRGRINSLLHPEEFNYSENIPWKASLHFTFNADGLAFVHFDYYNAHAASVWPVIGHAGYEYPLKFVMSEFSTAKDIQLCLNERFGRNVWQP